MQPFVNAFGILFSFVMFILGAAIGSLAAVVLVVGTIIVAGYVVYRLVPKSTRQRILELIDKW